MISAQQQATLTGTNCEIAFDSLTRQLYASDASIYQVEPVAVGFPRNARQASTLIQAAAQAGFSVIPRGAGTGLAGGAIGEGLVIDFSRHNRQITDLDLDRWTVRVGPGVVLDQLNQFLRPHGFAFGPDVATSSRATIGGMIANNSSGSHTPFYGTTGDHLNELELVLADGQIVMVGPGHDTLRKQRDLISEIVYFHSMEIAERMPPTLRKRRPGYALDACVRQPRNLLHLLAGSEGTLAAITAAELKIVPLPQRKGLGLIFFASIAEAMEASVALLALKPAAIEHIDRVLLDQTRGQREFQKARDLLDIDHRPFQSMLAVEFFEHVPENLAALRNLNLGMRTLLLQSPTEAALVWNLRKAGLSLLTGMKGNAKPVTGIEDAAVRPEDLRDYYLELQKLMGRYGLQASFYGHAASGLLHVRPVMDLHVPSEVARFRSLAEDVAALVSRFGGSLAGEHGVGIARTEFLSGQIGESLLEAMSEIKHSFDPHNLFNPGKIIPDGRYTFDANLRFQERPEEPLPFRSVLSFAAKDESFLGNLEQCNGCGGCRKESVMMCPTFIATGDEKMSTRGRANGIRAMLDGRFGEDGDRLRNPGLELLLSSCLSCRACVIECPSNVNLPLLKAELQHARIEKHGRSMRQRLFASMDLIGRLGCVWPGLSNRLTGFLVFRTLFSKALGLAWQRPVPTFAGRRFDRWFKKRPPGLSAHRGRVLLWDDTFVRYFEPHIGIAAVRVLEAAGFQVELVKNRKCCGRPAFSQGDLATARDLAEHNCRILGGDVDEAPILFLEPSCYSMFVQDYEELGIPEARQVARRCHLFDQFISELLSHEPHALRFDPTPARVVIHAHCHVRSLMSPAFLQTLAERLPGREVFLLETGCCGMAGGFGAMQANYELSLQVAEPLARLVRAQPFGTVVIASGTSCRQQIGHLAPVRPRHMAEVLAQALASTE